MIKKCTRELARFTAAVVLAGSLFPGMVVPSQAATLDEVREGFAKNVIIMIPDGMSHPGVTLTRWVYNDGKELHMDGMATGLIRTHNSDTAIADSAPAGTAMATGYKTQDKLVGVKPSAVTLPGARAVSSDEALAPAASILEAAKLNGKAIGIVATSEIQHATPADFSTHATHRGLYTSISEQQVYQNMDVVMGGGADYLLPDPKGSKDPKSKMRIDGENMQTAIKSLGYNYVTTRADMLKVKNGKLWGAFAPAALKRNMDRPAEEPSLAEMTSKSIELLSKDKDGFFLMVEGSQVDWAAHANDTIGLVSEIKAFDDAVGVALKYAKSNKDTLVIIASDHGNGGVSIGDGSTTKTYSELPISHFTATLKKAIMTEENAARLINEERSNIKEVMAKLGISDLTDEEIKAISDDKTGSVISRIVSNRAHVGWTTGGHTGEDIVLYVYSSDFRNTLTGTVQNSDIAQYAAKAMGLNLGAASKRLFIPESKLTGMGMTVVKDLSDPVNPVLIITKGGKTYRILADKNLMESGGKRISYNGINIYNGKQFYIPQAAIDVMK